MGRYPSHFNEFNNCNTCCRRGATGATGASGETGPLGASGASGATGDTGPADLAPLKVANLANSATPFPAGISPALYADIRIPSTDWLYDPNTGILQALRTGVYYFEYSMQFGVANTIVRAYLLDLSTNTPVEGSVQRSGLVTTTFSVSRSFLLFVMAGNLYQFNVVNSGGSVAPSDATPPNLNNGGAWSFNIIRAPSTLLP